MTPKERAAMQQALEAMEEGLIDDKWYAAKDAMREALAEQAEQEPVAIDGLARACNLAGIDYKDFLRIKAYLPIAAPVRTKDLTDDEIYTLYSEPCSDREMVEFARAVIAADREKNRG